MTSQIFAIITVQCVVDSHFQWVAGDPCMRNPLLCGQGLSVSLFYKGQTDRLSPADMWRPAQEFQRKYILSTGGARGFPGVGIFVQGPYLGKCSE
jgi:hypothetical protein